MTDAPGPIPSHDAATIRPVTHPPFPAVRLLYSLLFAVLAYLAVVLIFALAVVQFVVLAITGHLNDELKGFTIGLVRYVWEALAFITFQRDDLPFPMGPFPTQPPHS